MQHRRIRVGIVGLQPGRSWAARAHVPALRALPEDFELVGVANSNLASADSAAAACSIPKAFASAAELAASPDIDVVVVTVRVPHHLALVRAVIDAGKHVFCEWPLGNGLAEAEELAALADAAGVRGVVGTQARVAPEIQHVRCLIAEGFVGDVLSATVIGTGGGWGASLGNQATDAYLIDAANGATMLTIPFGHTLAALRDVLGDIDELSAVIATRRHQVLARDTGEMLPMTAADQVLMQGVLSSGAPVSMHYRGGSARGAGLMWEINGTKGDIRLTAPSGHAQMEQLRLEGATGDDRTFGPLPVPRAYQQGWPEAVGPGNVARVYSRMAADLRKGTRTAPDFHDAVGLHRVIEALKLAAKNGTRVSPNAPNRPLPLDVDPAK